MPGNRRISENVPAIFAAVMLVFIIVLMWLGWILIEQDGDLVTQRKRDAIDASVSEVLSTLTIRIAEDQRNLRQYVLDQSQSIGAAASTNGIVLRIIEDDFEVYPETALRYYPVEQAARVADPRLTEADRLEFGQRELERAASILEALEFHSNPDTRAGALMRLARIRKKQNREDDAFNTYLTLSQTINSSVGGIPADLLGIFGRCSLLESQEEYALLAEEAEKLGNLLLSGGHYIDKSLYQFYAQAVAAWLDLADSAPEIVESLTQTHIPSEAAMLLKEIWEGWTSGREVSEGFRSVRIGSDLVVLQWVGEGDMFVGLIRDSTFVQSQWSAELGSEFEVSGIGFSLRDDSGNQLYSIGQPSGNVQSARTLVSAGQTWTIAAYETESFEMTSQNRERRRILLGSLFLVIMIVATSTYFLSQALKREVAVAQLQSDFVSAVSHEFRTPLTSMRQIAEMLSSGRVPEDRRQKYYSDLDRESQRLSRLVEGLLNFGRMEAGSFSYVFERMSIGDIVGETVAEFRNEMGLGENELQMSIKGDPMCDLDSETFKLALWNLLDNAVKYSTNNPAITVSISTDESEVVLAVSDRGAGISAADQTRVFDKFVRGSNKNQASVKGTGLGLALVKRIVEKHAGRIVLESEPGVGSTFSMILPLQEST